MVPVVSVRRFVGVLRLCHESRFCLLTAFTFITFDAFKCFGAVVSARVVPHTRFAHFGLLMSAIWTASWVPAWVCANLQELPNLQVPWYRQSLIEATAAHVNKVKGYQGRQNRQRFQSNCQGPGGGSGVAYGDRGNSKERRGGGGRG